MMLAAGVDISGTAAHIVVAGTYREIKSASVHSVKQLDKLADGLADCAVVAIESPDRTSAPFV
jgi:hypothetical protein